MASEEQLSDDVPHRERDSCKCGDHDRGEDVDAESRPVLDGTSSRRPARSASRYRDPVTSTAAVRPRDRACASRARRRAPLPSPFSGTIDPQALQVRRRTSARALLDAVATSVSPSGRERREHPLGVLVARGSTRRRRSGGRAAAGAASRRRRGCARRRGSRAAALRDALEPAGQRTVPRPRPDRPAGRGTSPRRRRRARGCERPVSTPSAPTSGRAPATPARRGRPWRPPGRPRASRAAISSRVSPRRRCARGRRW